ncbi:MAG: transporter [Candidatus Omnitrophica bacterium CG11_big_fil_rev_8_21_14_0_20_42_13]|uniref:Transporter n=1 Tax=Candidatus Ghiorseimicrobium undicola TaxID=1974746 RepID=A0A2H0LX06_9BACT|nr:MAG: transporter [Candidatus Omnitrophica bacterium CG11_big_fil_rev_8_21_14_0_20_42_13]
MSKLITISFSALFFLCLFLNPATAEEILTWQECVKEAAKNHPDLISAEEKVRQSEAEKKITKSGLFPQVDGEVSVSTARTDSGTSSSTTDSYGYEASGTQLLFDGSKTINEVKSAAEDIKAAEFNYKFTSSTVRLRLRSAFINLLRAQELLRLTEEIFNIRRSNLVSITLRYESGLEHKGALLTAEANLAQARLEIAQAKRELELRQRELAKEMGRAEVNPVKVSGDFNVVNIEKEKPDFASIIKNNPSLLKAISQKNSAEFGLKSNYGEFYPTLSAKAGAGKSGARWAPENDQWNMGLTLSYPLFEGGLRFAQINKAEAFLNQLRADERSTKDGLMLALEEAWRGLQDAIDSVGVQKKFLEAVEARATIAEAQYSLGLIKFDDWTIIEDDLVRKKKSFLDAEANALLAEASWIAAKGEELLYVQK